MIVSKNIKDTKMASRKEKEIIFKEELIIDAAAKIFQENGFEAATMDKIAKEADYTKPTLYKYFKNKKEIIIGVYLKGWHDSLDKIYEAMEYADNGLNKLAAAADAYFDFFLKNGVYFDLISYMHSHNIKFEPKDYNRKTRYENRKKQLKEDFSAVFRLGIEDGTLCNEFSEEMATEYFLNNLYIAMFRVHSDENKNEEFLEISKKMILRTFKKL